MENSYTVELFSQISPTNHKKVSSFTVKSRFSDVAMKLAKEEVKKKGYTLLGASFSAERDLTICLRVKNG
jgi:hypothetical protein